jgi:UDP-GlcNAc:undecaprenyl-phosphate GlcNAc-1-phosphate transferase
VTNAFNLMDNMDGAAGTVALASSLGTGVMALIADDPTLAVFAFALGGACAGFLPSNLAKPSRIFLGDGGSLPIGFLIAAMIMACPPESSGLTGLLAAAPLVGLPIFDTVLVVISRYRRRVTIYTGGRDHLTHRLKAMLGSAQRVALALAFAQGMLCLLAIVLHGLDRTAVIEAAAGYLACGLALLLLLEGAIRTEVQPGHGQQPA